MTDKDKPTELSEVELEEAQGGSRWIDKSTPILMATGDAKDEETITNVKRVE